MQTRSTLGKRGHQDSSSPAVSLPVCDQLQTPENTPNPKRIRTTTTAVDGDSNKENIPPFKGSSTTPDSPRAARALRRTATEAISPARSRPATRRRASVASLPPVTPQTDISHLAIATPPPTPPTVLLPFHARVRALLRSTCNNSETQIAGRVNERASIVTFLSSFIQDVKVDETASPASMFISGTPGTGKTALVNSIIRDLASDANDDIKIISINCMALKDVDALWTRLVEDLSVGAKGKSSFKKLKGREGVKTLLSTLKTRCILILDELDHITPTAQSLTSIFTLTEALPTQLRLIGIANTHTLTSASATGFLLTADVTTIHFAPYTPIQLQEILESRLKSLASDESTDVASAVKKFLPTPTLMLLTKKVASLTGDVRSLFEVLRGAIDLAVASSTKSSKEENPLSTSAVSVVPQHVLAALKAYSPSTIAAKGSSAPSTNSNSETVTKIRNLGLQARLCLLIVLLASKRLESGLSLSSSINASPKKSTASPIKRSISLPSTSTTSPGVGVEISGLHTYYTNVLSRIESGLFEPVSRSEFGDLLGVLEGNGIVSMSSSLSTPSISSSPTKGRKTFGRSTSFGAGGKHGAGAVGEVRLVEGMWGDEVLRGLGVTASSPRFNDTGDSREEEVRAIWEREQSRLSKDVKAIALASSKNSFIDTFAGAFED